MSVRFFTAILLIVATAAQENLSNDRCNHYPDRGTCEDNFEVKWYYDRYGHRCREFFYGGCDGNSNRFDSKEECSQTCQPPLDQNDASRRCFLPFNEGEGGGDFERWYFDAQQGRCICTSWRGRGGNANLFYSHTHCMSICGAYAKEGAHQPPRSQAFADQANRHRQAHAERNGHRFAYQPVYGHTRESMGDPARFGHQSNSHASRSIDHMPIQVQAMSSDAGRPVYPFEQVYKFDDQQPEPSTFRSTKFKFYQNRHLRK